MSTEKRITFRADAELAERIERCRENGLNVSKIIRDILKQWVPIVTTDAQGNKLFHFDTSAWPAKLETR
jgi:methanogenic corrinoid protein MtbC1